MKIDGAAPLEGPADRKAASKASPKRDGKSFAAAFKKAAGAPAPISIGTPTAPSSTSSSTSTSVANPTPASVAMPAPAPAATSHTEPPAKNTKASQPSPVEPSAEDHLEMIKFRMKTGYYNSNSVDEALTEKLTGFFDELA
jgi:hypothetical protein